MFRRVATAAPPDVFQRVNCHGLTFLQIAAASLNFWVLTFVLRNFPVQAQCLVGMPQNAPLKGLAEAMAQPAPPSFTTPDTLPEHFKVSDMLQQDEFGAVPYADVAFDVGPDRTGVAACRFLAHRIVVSQSPVLFKALEKLPLSELPRENTHAAIFRVDPRISQEVWRSALQFMYTGVINCTYQEDIDKVVELLRACALYKLPKPLLEFAQLRLYHLLPRSPPKFVLQVFMIARDASPDIADSDFRCAKEASAYLLLRSAHRLFEGAGSTEACGLLEYAVQVAEHAVFNPVSTHSCVGVPLQGRTGAPPRRSLDMSMGSTWQSSPSLRVH